MSHLTRQQAAALDRYITGNYGEDQFAGDEPECRHDAGFAFYGRDPEGVLTWACRGCGDLFDRRHCGEVLRTGACLMDMGHRGRHSTVVFWCDGCSKTRRGHAVGQDRNVWDGEVEAEFCFMCMRGLS